MSKTTRPPGSDQHIQTDRRLVERGPGIASGLREFPRRVNVATLGAGFVAALFGCTGPALIIINGGTEAGLSTDQISSWIFGVYVFGGLISLVLGLYYRMPITGAYSIPGAVLVVGALQEFAFEEMVGAFLVAGVIVLLLGFSGLIRRVAAWLPFPIIMAMIAGALIRFGIGVVDAGLDAPIIVGAAVLGYLVLSRFVKAVPGVVGALVFGVAAAAATQSFAPMEGTLAVTAPMLFAPEFSLGAIAAVSIPLAVLVIGAENAQAIGVLMAERYRPPVNAMTLISGIGGMAASIFGGHNANIAGPMTAICSSEQAGEDRDGRFAATVINGVLFAAFGVVAGAAVVLITALPGSLIGAVAGLAMIGVLLSAFRGAFGGQRYQIGALVSLVIAMSGVTLLNISSPFWALLGGVLVSMIIEPNDFKRADEPTAA
jgi:benzoate membrane transport protein